MNLNQQAILFLEHGEYDKSFKTFTKATFKSRDVQSLNNLAYFYAKEKYDLKSAVSLLKEAVSLNPLSHFPYAMLGQILIEQEKHDEAISYLEKALEIEKTDENLYNLASCFYMVGKKEKASYYFSLVSNDSNNAKYALARSLFDIGKRDESEKILRNYEVKAELFSDDLFCEASIAELYMKLGFYEEAVSWYEKAWNSHAKEYEWVLGYVYSLFQLNLIDKAAAFIDLVLGEQNQNIMEEENDFEFDENWTIENKKERLKKLYAEKDKFSIIIKQINEGLFPEVAFDPSYQVACYLFGCSRHGHPEYHGKIK